MTTGRLMLLMAAVGIAGCGGSGGGSSVVNRPQTATAVATSPQGATPTGTATTLNNRAHPNQNPAAGSSSATAQGVAPPVSGATPAQTATVIATITTGTVTRTLTGPSTTPKSRAHSNQNPAAGSPPPSPTAQTAAPPVSGAKPAAGFMGSCLSGAGLGEVQLLRPNEWRGVVALKVKPVYVDGPYKSTSQAGTAADSLRGIESVASGGLYVVSAVLASHLDPYVNAVAKCLAAAGDAPSGQQPIPG